MKILAIESSCDETAAAVVEDGTKILSNVVASSTAMHEKYGGIVPEVAAREQLKVIIPVINEALDSAKLNYQSIDSLAVTVGPGLIGSLLIGVETAKTLAFVTKKPLIPVNHVIAHMYANFVEPIRHSREGGNPSTSYSSQPWIPDRVGDDKKEIQFPAISLVVSGGHTELFLMESVRKLTWLGGTLDDAAGEAFDKTARLLGFANGGGAAIEKAAQQFNNTTKQQYNVRFPRPLMHDETLNFSFSGLKTAVVRAWEKVEHNELNNTAFAYEIQEAITDVLVAKTLRAAEKYQAQSILISGGVASNTRLREKFNLNRFKLNIFFPALTLCTDNAAYIASYAFFKGKPVDWHDVTALPDLSVEENI